MSDFFYFHPVFIQPLLHFLLGDRLAPGGSGYGRLVAQPEPVKFFHLHAGLVANVGHPLFGRALHHLGVINRVFDGWPEDGPQAAVIWEAFKPDTEPRRSRRQGQADQLRELVLAQLRRGNGNGAAARNPADAEGAQQTDFVEESGGIY